MEEKLKNLVIALIDNEVRTPKQREAYHNILKDILQEETKEIPQMEGTMDMLNDLTIRQC